MAIFFSWSKKKKNGQQRKKCYRKTQFSLPTDSQQKILVFLAILFFFLANYGHCIGNARVKMWNFNENVSSSVLNFPYWHTFLLLTSSWFFVVRQCSSSFFVFLCFFLASKGQIRKRWFGGSVQARHICLLILEYMENIKLYRILN